ncbi:peptidoglycan editing factor PgeF [Pseudoduganella sp. LjRoot289]|uniref:peptidoglycan editing factor PgeF n=1 Tax=Pseudoduganella sp. LjRoot289 TaxID=3342314 RepID=UPI003ECF6BAC
MTQSRQVQQWLEPYWPGLPANIGALATTRRGGVSPAPYDDGQGGGGLNLGIHVGDQPHNVARNRALLAAHLPDQPLWLNQVHGVAVVDAGKVRPDSVPTADASIARMRNTVCAVLTADCLPVLFCDTTGTVVGAAHAGWRGLADGVLQETTRAMREAGAGEIMAWLGVAIGPVRFEVGNDVLQAFLKWAPDEQAEKEVRAAVVPIAGKPGKYLADLYALARSVLRRDGVTNIAGGEYCTVSNSGRFYSYRRDGVTGRQASLIWIK